VIRPPLGLPGLAPFSGGQRQAGSSMGHQAGSELDAFPVPERI